MTGWNNSRETVTWGMRGREEGGERGEGKEGGREGGRKQGE